MRVDVDKTRRDVKSTDIHGLDGRGGGDVFSHGGDFSAGNRHIAYGGDVVLRIDYAAALQQQIVLGLSSGNAGD